ncbi:MAG: toll/interleukin-1 receptor domain-containing protein [Anaerolineae bacterium]|nr:toll/interleukin-1 receptor domain-containing protein [Anaerolineae bacterium]
MSHVFISYSRENSKYAHDLASKLRELDFHVWIDDRIKSGDNWWEAIYRAIVECSAFIIIMTPESEKSKWVQREVTLAASLNKLAFPILLDGDPELSKSPLWSIYINTQHTSAKNGELPRPSFYEQLRAVVSVNTQKIRFDGYYECITHKSEGFNTFHLRWAIVFMPDHTLTEFSLTTVGMDIRTQHVLDDKHPDKGEYRVSGDIITIRITDPSIRYYQDATYHGYIEGDSLKLEIDVPRARVSGYEVPWHLKERRLYVFKPFPENRDVTDEFYIDIDPSAQ